MSHAISPNSVHVTLTLDQGTVQSISYHVMTAEAFQRLLDQLYATSHCIGGFVPHSSTLIPSNPSTS